VSTVGVTPNAADCRTAYRHPRPFLPSWSLASHSSMPRTGPGVRRVPWARRRLAPESPPRTAATPPTARRAATAGAVTRPGQYCNDYHLHPRAAGHPGGGGPSLSTPDPGIQQAGCIHQWGRACQSGGPVPAAAPGLSLPQDYTQGQPAILAPVGHQSTGTRACRRAGCTRAYGATHLYTADCIGRDRLHHTPESQHTIQRTKPENYHQSSAERGLYPSVATDKPDNRQVAAVTFNPFRYQ